MVEVVVVDAVVEVPVVVVVVVVVVMGGCRGRGRCSQRGPWGDAQVTWRITPKWPPGRPWLTQQARRRRQAPLPCGGEQRERWLA